MNETGVRGMTLPVGGVVSTFHVSVSIALVRPSEFLATAYSVCCPSAEAPARSPGLQPSLSEKSKPLAGGVAGSSRQSAIALSPCGSVAVTVISGGLMYQSLVPLGSNGDREISAVGSGSTHWITREASVLVLDVSWNKVGQRPAIPTSPPPPPPAPPSSDCPPPPPCHPAPPPPPPAAGQLSAPPAQPCDVGPGVGSTTVHAPLAPPAPPLESPSISAAPPFAPWPPE